MFQAFDIGRRPLIPSFTHFPVSSTPPSSMAILRHTMNSIPLIRGLLPALGLLALLGAPVSTMSAAEVTVGLSDSGDEHQHGVRPYPLETCMVCGMTLKDGEYKTMVMNGREMKCESDKCAAELKEKPEYYKGFFDGAERAKKGNIGPKGGDTRKGQN
jgi:hypothetical protein